MSNITEQNRIKHQIDNIGTISDEPERSNAACTKCPLMLFMAVCGFMPQYGAGGMSDKRYWDAPACYGQPVEPGIVLDTEIFR